MRPRQPWRRRESREDQRDGYGRARAVQQAPRLLAEAHDAWRRGLVKPWRITLALDAKGLYGPEVDEACGVAEPFVDQWEAGERYPTWEQLQALADLTGCTPAFFMVDAPMLMASQTTMRFHISPAELADEKPPVERYPRAVVEEVVR